MDFRPAYERLEAERERRWLEYREDRSPAKKRADHLRLILGSFVAAAVLVLQRVGVSWIFPVYVAVCFAWVAYEVIRHYRRG